MTHYAFDLARPPRTLTVSEQTALLRTSGQHVRGFRDHLMFSMTLGTGLRCHELAALDVGDVFQPDGTVRRRVKLRVFKRSAKNPARQEVILPDTLMAKLTKFYKRKRALGESLAPDAALFVSERGTRIALRSMRHAFARWRERSGIDPALSLHALRHTSCSTVYRRHKDPLLVQRFARHTSLRTTSIYLHTDDEGMLQALRDQPC